MTQLLPSLSSLDAVILDLDGTLVDTLGDFTAALGAMAADLGLEASALTPPVVERMVGKGSEHLIRTALAHLAQGQLPGQAHDEAALSAGVERLYPAAWASYQAHYARINGSHCLVYPGVHEGLREMTAQGLTLACVTNKPVAFAQELLRRKNLSGAFAHVFGGDSFERKKPDPLPLLETCKALGTAAGRTLMVGDSVNDALAARGAGCPVVLVSYGYNHGRPIREVPADGYVDSIAELC